MFVLIMETFFRIVAARHPLISLKSPLVMRHSDLWKWAYNLKPLSHVECHYTGMERKTSSKKPLCKGGSQNKQLFIAVIAYNGVWKPDAVRLASWRLCVKMEAWATTPPTMSQRPCLTQPSFSPHYLIISYKIHHYCERSCTVCLIGNGMY